LNEHARDIQSLRIAHKTVVAMDHGGRLELGGYLNDKDLYHPIFQVIDQESVDVGGFGRYNISWALGEHLNESVLGVNVGRGVNNADRFVNVQGNRGARTMNTRQQALNYELYGENRFYLNAAWQVVTGLQARIAQRDYTDHLNSNNNADQTFRSLNPKFGIMWDVAGDAEIFAGLSKSSEAPTFGELVQGAVAGFVPVRQQRAWTAEVGSRGRMDSGVGALAWDITLYRAWIKDEMLQYNVGSSVPAATFNAGDTVHQGIELGASYQPQPWLTLDAIYNLNDFYFDGDRQFGDNQIAGAPPHQLRFSARYDGGRFHVAPYVEWVPEAAFVDFANTLKADAYTTLGVKAGWQPQAQISLFVDARNLTDERYIPTFSTVADATRDATNVFYPAEGRAVYAGISIKF
ncbi:MAG TPA: TonB-dependent receptor, partial [Micavibrio sp.]